MLLRFFGSQWHRHAYTRSVMHICIHICTHMCICTYMYTCLHPHTSTHLHVYIYIDVHIYVCTHVYTYHQAVILHFTIVFCDPHDPANCRYLSPLQLSIPLPLRPFIPLSPYVSDTNLVICHCSPDRLSFVIFLLSSPA